MADSAIFLKRGVHLAHLVLAMFVPPTEVPHEEDAAAGAEAPQE